MDYQAILDLVAPLDAFVTEYRSIVPVLQLWIVLQVIHICRKRYGTLFDTKTRGDGYGFLENQAKSEWENWKKYRK